jgi:hypothetical protein
MLLGFLISGTMLMVSNREVSRSTEASADVARPVLSAGCYSCDGRKVACNDQGVGQQVAAVIRQHGRSARSFCGVFFSNDISCIHRFSGRGLYRLVKVWRGGGRSERPPLLSPAIEKTYQYQRRSVSIQDPMWL